MSLEGRLEDLGLPDIFQIISLSRRSGILTLIRKEGTARLVFSQGQVMFASSDSQSRLGYTLVRKEIISNDDLEYALRIQKGRGSVKPLGTILLEMGAIDQETLEREIHEHIIQVIQDLLGWDTGSFHFELGQAMEEDVVLKVGLKTDFLLLEATRRKDEENRGSGEQASAKARPTTGRAERLEDLEKTQVVRSPPARNPGESVTREPPQKSAPPPIDLRKDLALLATMIGELSGPSTSSEITLLVLRFASEIMSRAVILLVRKNELIGLGQFGVSLPEGSAQDWAASIRIPLTGPSVFKDVVEKRLVYKGSLSTSQWHSYFIEKLGKDWPSQIFTAPIICEGHVIAILYGDDVPDLKGIPETEGLEAFLKVSGFAFGKALLERKLQDYRSSRPT